MQTGEVGLLTDLMRQILQTGLEVEIADRLGYERGEAPPGGLSNARNGAYDKSLTTEISEGELRVASRIRAAVGRSITATIGTGPISSTPAAASLATSGGTTLADAQRSVVSLAL